MEAELEPGACLTLGHLLLKLIKNFCHFIKIWNPYVSVSFFFSEQNLTLPGTT